MKCQHNTCTNPTRSERSKYCEDCRHLRRVAAGIRLGNLTPLQDRMKKPRLHVKGPFLASFEDNILAAYIEKRPHRDHKHQIEFIDRHVARGREIRTLDREQLDFAIVEREALGRLVRG